MVILAFLLMAVGAVGICVGLLSIGTDVLLLSITRKRAFEILLAGLTAMVVGFALILHSGA